MKKLLVAALTGMMFLSCSQNGTVSGKRNEAKQTRSIVNAGNYKDVTLENVDASLITLEDFKNTVNGKYSNGNNYIQFENNVCLVHFENTKLKGYEGKTVDASFIYKIKSASKNCLYVMPVSMMQETCRIDYEIKNVMNIPSLSLYIPFYGYGDQRLEISSILNGETSAVSGTYLK